MGIARVTGGIAVFAAVGTNVKRLVTKTAPPTVSSRFWSRKVCVKVIKSMA